MYGSGFNEKDAFRAAEKGLIGVIFDATYEEVRLLTALFNCHH